MILYKIIELFVLVLKKNILGMFVLGLQILGIFGLELFSFIIGYSMICKCPESSAVICVGSSGFNGVTIRKLCRLQSSKKAVQTLVLALVEAAQTAVLPLYILKRPSVVSYRNL